MLLKEQDAEYADLLQHNDVRWLSRGRVLERFFALYKEVSEFLSGQKSAKSQELLAFIQDAEFISHLAFLCDITSHLNTLNLQLQGGGASVGELLHKVNAFQSELDVYLSDLKGRKLHFPSLRSVPAENAASLSAMVEVLKCLRENFKTRFEHFKIPSEVLRFLRDPFGVSATGTCPAEANALLPVIDEGTFQLEMAKLQTDDLAKGNFKKEELWVFWTRSAQQYKNCNKLAIYLLTMFGSTYICESGFSTMNLIKDQKRNRLTDAHLSQCMHLALTSHKPVFSNIAMERVCHPSH